LVFSVSFCRNAICLKKSLAETTFAEINIAQMTLAEKKYFAEEIIFA
jgi:hypothetical protein